MYLLTNIADEDPTKTALMRSSLELLAEKGYKGATTREIATKAGVSEVTLFRHYKSKEELLRTAVERISPPVEQIVPNRVENLEAALLRLVRNLHALIEANQGFMIRLLPELMRHPELRGEGGTTGFMRAFAAGSGFIQHCQEAGLLRADELPQQMVVALVGPLIARVLLGGAWGVSLPLDLEAHVRGFLDGRRADGQR
ncbi:MAG: TetR family transcriptional regulator [Meiothermus sp.]